MELIILHIRNLALCSVNEGYSVAGGDNGVGCIFVNVACAAGCNQRNFRSDFLDFFMLFIKDVSAVTIDVSFVQFFSRNVVLGNQVNNIMVRKHLDIGRIIDGFQKGSFYLKTGNVFVVNDSVFGMAALSAESISAFFLIKFGAPFHNLIETMWCFFHNHFYDVRIVNIIACPQRIINMFLEIIFGEICNHG